MKENYKITVTERNVENFDHMNPDDAKHYRFQAMWDHFNSPMMKGWPSGTGTTPDQAMGELIEKTQYIDSVPKLEQCEISIRYQSN